MRIPLLLLSLIAASVNAANWPSWRGPDNNGVSAEKSFPTTWSKSSNITWQTPLPGGGNSTPIVWGNKVFITCALEKGARRAVMCFDRKDGKLLWQKEVTYATKEPTHETNPYCSSSPITDGERVIAWQGSAGIVAYDMDGTQLWHRTDLGEFTHIWGNASTPLLDGDNLIAYCGPGLNVFIAAFDKKTGKDVWRIEIPDAKAKTVDQFYGSWSSPVIRETTDKKKELIVGLPKQVVAYDLETRKEKWSCKGLGPLVYTNPLVSGETVVVMSGYGGPAIGVRAGGSGDVTETNRLWQITDKNPQRVGSGIIVGDHIYILNDPGFAQCIELKTGKEVWREKLGVTSWSSMSYAGEKLYVIDFKGETFVLNASPEFRLVARNPLGEMTRASHAFSDGQIFIRTYAALYCIGPAK